MKRHQLVALVAAIATTTVATVASAQTPEPRPDVDLSATAGVYPITCVTPDDLDLVEICWLRVDLPGDPIELDCMPTTGPNKPHTIDLVIAKTPDVDAEIKCRVTDDEDLKGNLSANSGWADFTRPGAPWVVTELPITRAWPPLQLRDLELAVEPEQVAALYSPRERARRGLKHLVLSIED